MGDEQHGLGGLPQLLLEPALAGDVEVVVRLVEQQDLVRAAQQGLQDDALLLAAGERAHLAVLRPAERDPEGGRAADVPEHLDVIAAGVRPVGKRLGIAHLRPLVVGVHHRQLGPLEGRRGSTYARRGHGQQEVAHRAVVADAADELTHHAESAAHQDGAAAGIEVAADDAQEGGLAGPVGAHECGLRALTDPERDLVEEDASVREDVRHLVQLDVTHEGASFPLPPRGGTRFSA